MDRFLFYCGTRGSIFDFLYWTASCYNVCFCCLISIEVSLVEIHLAIMHLPKYQYGDGAKCYVSTFGVDYSLSYMLS
jgi:hypothetical protein